MRLRVSAPGVEAELEADGSLLVTAIEGRRAVRLRREGGSWAVHSADGERLGDLGRLDRSSVERAGLRDNVALLMRGAVQAAAAAPDPGPPPPDGPEAYEHALLEADGLHGEPNRHLPVEALSGCGAEGWRAASAAWSPDGRLLSVLLERRLR
jgi:hypothetical protein